MFWKNKIKESFKPTEITVTVIIGDEHWEGVMSFEKTSEMLEIDVNDIKSVFSDIENLGHTTGDLVREDRGERTSGAPVVPPGASLGSYVRTG